MYLPALKKDIRCTK